MIPTKTMLEILSSPQTCMSVASRFDRFLANIKLTSSQLQDAQKKYDGVCKKLHDYFYPGMWYNGATKLLIGSYGKNTNIRPARDVDVIFKVLWTEFEQGNIFSNVQSNLLQKVKRILKEKYPDTDIRADDQVVVVNFSSIHFIEVVPGFEFATGDLAGKFYIPDTHGGHSWKLADPRSELANISNSDSRSKGNTRNLIRMLKRWQDYCNVPIKSLVLELRTVNFMEKYQYSDKPSLYYDWMVRDFLGELLGYVGGSCQMPGLEQKIKYGDEWKSKAESAYFRAKKACEYEAANKEIDATIEWKKLFGDDFSV